MSNLHYNASPSSSRSSFKTMRQDDADPRSDSSTGFIPRYFGEPRSQHSPIVTPERLPPGVCKQRFIDAVRRVMTLQRAMRLMTPKPSFVGAEPGIDPRGASANAQYGHLREWCTIEVVDYSVTRCAVRQVDNAEFVRMLESSEGQREPWARVRWVNVGGISWDVLRALGLQYDMHPLALEDVVHQGSNRSLSKADYYTQHLFIRVLCHKLGSDKDGLPHALSHIGFGVPAERLTSEVYGTTTGKTSASRRTTKPWWKPRWAAADADVETDPVARRLPMQAPRSPPARPEKLPHALALVQKLKLENQACVLVSISPLSIFLFRDGTVVSISTEANGDFTAPIRNRLRRPDTVLRRSPDPSLLVQSLLDFVVDQALEVVEEYHSKILNLEQNVLMRPSMETVTALHMLQEDLTMHRRTLEPIKTLVHGLRRYDADRAAAVVESEEGNVHKSVGFMSRKAKVYLADVHDHMEYILMSLDMFAGISDNLIKYTCNMVSYQMNEGMRRLTLVTIIFLPLTFLSGYFGMNFESFPAIQNTDVYFWKLSVPVLAAMMPMFMWPDIMRASHYLQRRLAGKLVS